MVALALPAPGRVAEGRERVRPQPLRPQKRGSQGSRPMRHRAWGVIVSVGLHDTITPAPGPPTSPPSPLSHKERGSQRRGRVCSRARTPPRRNLTRKSFRIYSVYQIRRGDMGLPESIRLRTSLCVQGNFALRVHPSSSMLSMRRRLQSVMSRSAKRRVRLYRRTRHQGKPRGVSQHHSRVTGARHALRARIPHRNAPFIG